jgi:hypothetical protein
MTFISQCEKRKQIRKELLKEWEAAGAPPKKKNHKQSVSLCKKESPRSKFLKKPGNKPVKGDTITFMPAMKKKPKEQRLP